MPAEQASESLGLNLSLQRPAPSDLRQIPATRDKDGRIIYPEVDADGDHLHFEMVPMSGESLLWLTMRRGTTPEVASAALRKIADLIDRHGERRLREVGVVEVEVAGELAESPPDLAHHHVADREVDARVRAVDVPVRLHGPFS